jgi:dCMP deaminase
MRPDKQTYFMMITDIVAKRSTCLRRQVGCILVDSDANIKATGYNGVVSGMTHCDTCARELKASGSELWDCPVIHAEINAISRYEGSRKDIQSIYCTTLPCYHCAKVIANTFPSLQELHYHTDYPHSELIKKVFLSRGIKLFLHQPEGIIEINLG